MARHHPLEGHSDGTLSALLGYAYRAVARIQSPEDREWLRRGLAAISFTFPAIESYSPASPAG